MKNEETINFTVADLRRAHDSVSCSTAKQVIKALKPEAFEEEAIIHIPGNIYQHKDGDKYILATVGNSLICLINLDNGNRFRNPYKVENGYRITKSDWFWISLDEFKPLNK